MPDARGQAHVLHESLSLCPECFATIPCRYEAEDGAVFQAKTCKEHGDFRSLYWHDVEHFEWTRSYAPEQPEQPAACDVAGDPGRARCLAVVDVTENCDLACSYCFAGSRPGLPVLPTDAVRAKLQTVLDHGGPTPIQLSGGEPTTRDDLPEIIAMACDMGFRHIEVNSNGIRLAEEDGYAAALAAAGASTVYLQFDGFGKKVYKRLRGRDLTAIKQAAVEACREAGLSVILVPTVVAGVNEDQLGDIVRFALRNLDVVRGVNVQPVSHFGRHADDTGHLSLPRIAELLSEQLAFLRPRDLLQVPCCSPNCSSATMLLSFGEDADGNPKATPLTRFVSDDAYRDVVTAFEREHFMDLLAGRDDGVQAAKDAAGCCGVPVPEGLERFLPRMLALTVTGFMDADTVDLERLGSCCINVPTADGQLVPFCGYNLTTRSGEYGLRRQYQEAARRAREPNALPMAV